MVTVAQGITCVTISQRLSLPEFHVADLRMGENNKNGYTLAEIDAKLGTVIGVTAPKAAVRRCNSGRAPLARRPSRGPWAGARGCPPAGGALLSGWWTGPGPWAAGHADGLPAYGLLQAYMYIIR